MIPTSVLVELATLGLSKEQAEKVAEMLSAVENATRESSESVLEKSREKARARLQRWKEKKENVSKRSETSPNVKSGSHEGVARGLDNLQKQKISGKEEKKDSAPSARAGLDAFRAELSSILDPERIEALIAVRRKKGATMTPHAGRLLAKALRQCPDAHAAADEMVLRNWTGIKPEWLESRSPPPRQATSPPQNDIAAAFDAIAAGKSPFPESHHEPDFPTIETSYERRN